MDFTKINLYVVGLCLIFTGGTVLYLYGYKNEEWVIAITYICSIMGVVTLMLKATKGTIVDAPKIFFRDDKAGFFKQGFFRLIAYVVPTALVLGLMVWLSEQGYKRRDNILQNEPTGYTTAVVNYIDVRKSRNSISYYAVFVYTVNGKQITHAWYERQESDFLVGEKFRIKYSLSHPDMFYLLDKVQ